MRRSDSKILPGFLECSYKGVIEIFSSTALVKLSNLGGMGRIKRIGEMGKLVNSGKLGKPIS